MCAYQRPRINNFILHIIMCISVLHQWRNSGYRQIELGGDAKEWEDICMSQLAPDMHFLEEFLFKDQSVIER